MKILIASLIFLFLTSIATSQSSTEPLQLNKIFLVSSAGLPEEFLIFSPDSATQILFNPARAKSFSSNFVYINYLSDFVSSSSIVPPALAEHGIFNFPAINEEVYKLKNPTFSFAALFSSKWLLSFLSGINSSTLESNLTDYGEVTSSYNQTQNRIVTSNTKLDQSLTSLKISRIWGNLANSYSLGIFGIIYNNNENRNRFYENSENYKPYSADTIIYRTFIKNGYNDLTDESVKKMAAGLEFSANNSNWDLISSISYQRINSPQNNTGNYYNVQFDSSSVIYPVQWQTSGKIIDVFLNEELNGNINGINMSNYFRYRINWLNEGDNIFVSLNAFYLSGDRSFNREVLRIESTIANNTSAVDTINNQTSDKLRSKNWGIKLSAGYAINFSLSDINILSGLRLRADYNNFEDKTINISSPYSTSFYNTIEKNSSAALTFPLSISYSPDSWVSIYGGLNYSYYYYMQKSEKNSDYVSLISSSNSRQTEIDYRKTTQWQSSKSIYAGCEFKHKSGFRVQLFFDQDFTNIRDWNVSAGYNF